MKQPARQLSVKESKYLVKKGSFSENKKIDMALNFSHTMKYSVEDGLGLFIDRNAQNSKYDRASTQNRVKCLGIGERLLTDSENEDSDNDDMSIKKHTHTTVKLSKNADF